MMNNEIWTEAAKYWEGQLAGLPQFEVPPDHPRVAGGASRRGHTLSRLLPAGLVNRLEEIGRASEVTPFMTFVAALVTLLHRRTGQTDIVVGSPVVCRNTPEIEAHIGPAINLLALRFKVAGDPAFTQLLPQVRGVVSKALEYDFYPLEKAAGARPIGGARRAAARPTSTSCTSVDWFAWTTCQA